MENNVLNEYRKQIDAIDMQLMELFLSRMEIVRQVAGYKLVNGMPVLQPEREKEILDKRAASAPSGVEDYTRTFFEALMSVSRKMQESIIAEYR